MNQFFSKVIKLKTLNLIEFLHELHGIIILTNTVSLAIKNLFRMFEQFFHNHARNH